MTREQEACDDGARGQGFMGLKHHIQILLLHPPIWLKTEYAIKELLGSFQNHSNDSPSLGPPLLRTEGLKAFPA